tara:strand:+ start:57 stop:551 length:495 start_codon:yes stop_codon:yes gene_type:complete
MQCSPQHRFNTGDKITIKTNPIPSHLKKPRRSDSRISQPFSDIIILDDGRFAPKTFIVTNAFLNQPVSKFSEAPFEYQRLEIKSVDCKETKTESVKNLHDESYSNKQYLDVTTMTVRDGCREVPTHYITKIYVYDNLKKSIIKKNSSGELISHCPCSECCLHFE